MIKRTQQERIDIVKYIIKKVVSKRGTTEIDVLKKMSELYERNPRQSNFSARQSRGTVTAVELIEILDYLGFRLAIIDENSNINEPEKL